MTQRRTVAAERERWLQATIDMSGDGHAVLRAARHHGAIVDWILVEANALVRERWASVAVDVVGMSLSVLDGAADNSGLLATYATALAEGARTEVEFRLALPGRPDAWRRVIVIPIDADTVSVITRDITRERYLEATAQRERHRLSGLVGAGRLARHERPNGSDSHVTKWSAFALFVAAGVASLVNSVIVTGDNVDRGNLRWTGAITIVFGFVSLFLPWERHHRKVAIAIVASTIALIGVTDRLHHYSGEQAALAIYPVFFIVVITWSGLTLGRWAPSITAIACTPVLIFMFASTGRGNVGLQCAAVTLPTAAMLGEVLAHSWGRARALVQLEASRRLHDPLTGLANRVHFCGLLDQALATSRRSLEPVAVLFVDLDGFKNVNDSLGHTAGDELLVEAAERMNCNVREGDTVARFGGDEFVVLCDGASVVEAEAIARRLIEVLSNMFRCGSGEAVIGASVGVVVNSDSNETSETMLQKADIAMYRAKAAGRGGVALFDTAMQEWVSSRNVLDLALRSALDNDEMRLLYQPIVDAEEATIVGFEALLRWDRPGFGLVPPSEFLAIAEESGLIVKIGGWVLTEACREAVLWNRRTPDRQRSVSVNVASSQLRKGRILQQVDAALAASGLSPQLLTLELTESTLIDDAIDVTSTLVTLRERGIRIALDDFGTGYCSLTYLRAFPIDVIKVDRSFVQTVGTERGDTAIVAAVVTLARNLGIDVVGEGVETSEQLASLLVLNCRLLQGYLFSPPMPPDLIAAFIATPAALRIDR